MDAFMSKIRTNQWEERENFCLLTLQYYTTPIAIVCYLFLSRHRPSIASILNKKMPRESKKELKMFFFCIFSTTSNK
jgi:Na+/H+-dicarboxylate symporter